MRELLDFSDCYGYYIGDFLLFHRFFCLYQFFGSEGIMKRISVIFGIACILTLLLAIDSDAQFRDQQTGTPRVADAIVTSDSPSFFSFFSPENFRMRHSYTMSYMTGGGQGMAVGMYTNSMFYKLADPLNVQLDVSLMHSPYNSFNRNMEDNSNLFISRAEINYQPSEHFRIQLQYRQIPYTDYFGYYGSRYYQPWYRY